MDSSAMDSFCLQFISIVLLVFAQFISQMKQFCDEETRNTRNPNTFRYRWDSAVLQASMPPPALGAPQDFTQKGGGPPGRHIGF